MKIKTNILIIIILLGSSLSLIAQDKNFTLKAKIIGQQNGMLKISYNGPENKVVKDSGLIENGTIEFKGLLNEPSMAYFTGDVKSRGINDPNAAAFFLEPREMTLEITTGDFKNFKLTGSKTQEEYAALNKLKEPITQKMKPVYEAFQEANKTYIQAIKDKTNDAELAVIKEKASSLRSQLDPFYERQSEIDMAFIKSHPNSFLSAYILRWKTPPITVLKSLYDKLSANVKQSSHGKAIQEKIKKLAGGSAGSLASVFATKDISGEPLSLTDFTGKKYVLLDFWASWCVPCRKGNPHLLSLYNQYKEKGLEIIGISDNDSTPDAWKKAVAQDKIGVWKHVLRGLKRTPKGYDKTNDINELYSINTLPTKILIDKKGMIVGRYGGGGDTDEAMDKKLAEIFK